MKVAPCDKTIFLENPNDPTTQRPNDPINHFP